MYGPPTPDGGAIGQWLSHDLGPAPVREFYAALPKPARVGLEASGYSQWYEEMLEELGIELWVGDPARIRKAAPRKQKTDRNDARLLLQLLEENRFPRIWVPDKATRDLRQLLMHRHKLVTMRIIPNPHIPNAKIIFKTWHSEHTQLDKLDIARSRAEEVAGAADPGPTADAGLAARGLVTFSCKPLVYQVGYIHCGSDASTLQ